MATDIWNGNGDWTGNPADWSSGAPPSANDIAIIQSGTSTLSTSGTAAALRIITALNLGDGASLTTSRALVNAGTLNITGNGDTVNIGGVLDTVGTTTIGTTGLSASTTVTAAGLQGSGYLVVQGNTALSTTNQATLAVTGTTSSVVTGSIRVLGDADLQLTTGITTVAGGGFLQIDGANARISLGAGTASTALTGLAKNYGTVNFDGNSNLGYGGTVVTTNTSFANAATLWIDVYGGDGGTTVTFGGLLNNTGTAIIGNTSLGTAGTGNASTLVTATGLVNQGTLTLLGNNGGTTTNQATLRITGSGSSLATGTTVIGGDADLALSTGYTGIGYNAILEVDGSLARVSSGLGSTNSGLTGLASNIGTFRLRGNTGYGSGGTTVTTNTAFNNTGLVQIDADQGGEGGSTFNIGGTLTNAGPNSFNIGNSSLSASTTVTATILNNTSSLYLEGNNSGVSSNQATLQITGAGVAVTTGTTLVGGDADLALASGITSVGVNSTLEIDGQQARVSVGLGTTNSALSGLGSNAGTFRLRGDTGFGTGGTTVTTTAGFSNTGTLQVDSYQNGEGGSTLKLGGTLVNSGSVSIGDSALSASTTVMATGLSSSNFLSLLGNNSGSSSNQATLQSTGKSSLSGYVLVGGDADLALNNGVTSVGNGTTLEIDGLQARVSMGLGTTNSALTGLASNAGTFRLRGNTGDGTGGTTVTTSTTFSNSGTLQVDGYGNGDGGSTLNIGSALSNTGSLAIGNNSLSASTTVTATGLNSSNFLALEGNNSGSSSNLATLKISGNTSLSGYVLVAGDADLALNNGITTVGLNQTLEVDGSQARISLGLGTTNSALTGLSSNTGYFRLRGNTGGGAGGTTVTTNTAFQNAGTLQVDGYGNGDGGSTFNIGGALVNSGTVNIGNNSLNGTTTVTATGLTNNSYIDVEGNNSGSSTSLATLQITGSTSNTTSGFTLVGGDADLALTTGITSIGSGATLEIDGQQARVSLGLGTNNSGLSGLASNAGVFRLRGNTGIGAGGTTVTTSTALTNTGTLQIDGYGNGDGGSTLAIGGLLVNNNTLDIGNNYLGASTTVTATSLSNNGITYLEGNNSGSSTKQATLQATGPNAATMTGFTLIGGDADLALATAITSIGSGATLEIDGQQARVSLGLGSGNSALTGLTSNAGLLRLRGDTNFGSGGATVSTTSAFSNTGTIQLDSYSNSDGGSTLSFAGSLINSGIISIGNYYESAATKITSGALTNNGSFTLNDDSSTSNVTQFVSSGAATNTGTVYVGVGTKLIMNGSSTYSQQGGSTTVAGLLTANTITDSGGTLDFKSALTSGNGTGAITLSGGATLQFDASVDSSHTVTFSGDDAGTMNLSSPSTFGGVIAGFAGSDAIDLLNTAVTGLSYSGTGTSGTLTVTNSGGTAATLAFNGSYTTSRFSAVSDGHGGTLILDPPASASSTTLPGHHMGNRTTL